MLSTTGARRAMAALKGYVRLGRVMPTALNSWQPPAQARTARSSSVMPQVLALVSLREWMFKLSELLVRSADGVTLHCFPIPPTNEELSA